MCLAKIIVVQIPIQSKYLLKINNVRLAVKPGTTNIIKHVVGADMCNYYLIY